MQWNKLGLIWIIFFCLFFLRSVALLNRFQSQHARITHICVAETWRHGCDLALANFKKAHMTWHQQLKTCFGFMAGNDAGTAVRLCMWAHGNTFPCYLFIIFFATRSYVLGLRRDGRSVRMPLLAGRQASIWLGSSSEERGSCGG